MHTAFAVLIFTALCVDVSSIFPSSFNIRSVDYFRKLLLASEFRFHTLATHGSTSRKSRGTGTQGGLGSSCVTSGRASGVCSPPSTCLLNFPTASERENSGCDAGDGGLGLCCPQIVSSRFTPKFDVQNSIQPLPRSTVKESAPIPRISSRSISIAGRTGVQRIQGRSGLENTLKSQGIFLPKRTAPAFHQAFFGSQQKALDVARDGFAFVEASLRLASEFNLNSRQGSAGLNQLSAAGTNLRCPEIPVCNPRDKYRTADGSCNNLRNPLWGRSFTAFDRILQPDYADGISSPRRSSDGGPLPSARVVSSVVATSNDVPSNEYTHLMMQFGQFLDHDFTLLAVTRASNDIVIRCCGPELDRNPDLRHPECLPIAIPRNDPFFSRFNEVCMEFVRSAAAPPNDCKLGPRQQINQLTSFIDASMVYGSTEEEARELREFRDGLLKVTVQGNRKLLPLEKEHFEECDRERSDQFCFKAGDERVNEQIDLAAFHTVFLREHNRIVRTLKQLNPSWNDERLYQEGRKILGAVYQHMVYNEFLPLLLGYTVMKIFDILPQQFGYSNTYDETLNPTVFNAFGGAAFRYGHTLVQDEFSVSNSNGQTTEELPIADTFNKPFRLLEERPLLDGLLRGLTNQPAQSFDSFITPQLSTMLFRSPGERFGLDLISLNLQRGRDHGLPSYNKYREICGLKKLESFSDLDKVMKPGAANRIRAAGYRNVDDIDLFIAGISERRFPGANLGPTFACLIGGQFARLKHGDRFFYTNGGRNPVFTPAQLDQIRKANLARILCDNGDNIRYIQPIPYLQSGVWNGRTSCDSKRIPKLDLSAWQETSRPTNGGYLSEVQDQIDDLYKNIQWGT